MECLIPQRSSLSLRDNVSKTPRFFDKYKIIGVKSEDYQDFKKVAQLMENKAHLTIEGLENIRRIKAKMNRGRTQFDEEKGYFTK